MFEFRVQGRYLIVTPMIDKLHADNAADFRSSLIKRLEVESRFVLLDLNNVRFMDSSGLAAIVFCFQMTNIRENLAIVGVQERVNKLFEMTHMHKVVHIFKDLNEAEAVLNEDKAAGHR